MPRMRQRVRCENPLQLNRAFESGQAQVDLFAAPPPPPAEREARPLAAALGAIDPDRLSPREALEALYRLKALSREDPS